MTIYQPYFYVIQDTRNGMYYAGAKWGKDADPLTFMIENGYKTSSLIINRIVKKHGLSTFITRKIKIFETADDAKAYETKFLNKVNAKYNEKFYNKHNNDRPVLSEKSKEKMSIRRKGIPKTEEHKKKISDGNKGKIRTEEMKKLQSEKMKGRKLSESHKNKIKKNGRSGTENRICITNGVENYYISKEDKIPNGYHKGMTKKEPKTRFINDGVNNKRIPVYENLPEGWNEGLIKKKVRRIWINDGKKQEILVEAGNNIQDGWKRGRLK